MPGTYCYRCDELTMNSCAGGCAVVLCEKCQESCPDCGPARRPMTYLSRDAILQREDIKTEDVDVPEWGGTVRVRGMSGVERDAFEAGLIQQPPTNGARRRKQAATQTNMANVRAKMCAWCIVDENGARLFSDADVVALGAKSAAALDRIYEVASALSGITEDDVEEMAEEMIEDPFEETSTP